MRYRLQSLLICFMMIASAFGQYVEPSEIIDSAPVTSSQVSGGQSAQVPAAVGSADYQFPLLRTFGGMGIVICLMIAAYFAFRKLSPQYFNKQKSERNLRVIETLAMGDRRSISLIEVANSRFLIGNTPNQINLLAALPEGLSLVSEPDVVPAPARNLKRRDAATHFRNLFEVEKSQLSKSAAPHPQIPEDLRAKMRQLREALERP